MTLSGQGSVGEAGREIRGQACAKINLSLKVTGRRPDGYHELESLVVFAALGDELSFAPAEALSLRLEGRFAAKLTAEPDNLVLKAARALQQAFACGKGARITLSKELPVAAGLGGGSADAAAALRALCELWDLPCDEAGLLALAAGLGADVPVCLTASPSFVTGIGEILTPAPALPELWVLLVNPGQALSTADVFAARDGPYAPPSGPPAAFDGPEGLLAWLADHGNDLEAPARRLLPEIGEVLPVIAAQPACRLARMSGSGATCFGLFLEEGAAAAAADAIGRRAPDWWCGQGRIMVAGQTYPAT